MGNEKDTNNSKQICCLPQKLWNTDFIVAAKVQMKLDFSPFLYKSFQA